MSLDLGSQSWPSDLLFLRDRFPRQGWATNPALGDLAQFWLRKHDSLRHLGSELDRSGAALRDGRLHPGQLQAGFIPALRAFLESLESHHQVEDQHYFPIFRSAERRLARGFEILESDHAILHAQIMTVIDLARRFAQHPAAEGLARHADEYVQAATILTSGVRTHLGDEEDLVIPLLASQVG